LSSHPSFEVDSNLWLSIFPEEAHGRDEYNRRVWNPVEILGNGKWA